MLGYSKQVRIKQVSKPSRNSSVSVIFARHSVISSTALSVAFINGSGGTSSLLATQIIAARASVASARVLCTLRVSG